MIQFPANAARSVLISLVAIAAGLAVLAFSFLRVKGEWFDSYLVAWLYWTGISLGSLSLLLLHNLTGGAWGNAVRPAMSAAAAVLPVMAALFLPVLIQPQRLYHWADSSVVNEDLVLQHKQAYLNVNFFQLRAAMYFVVWLGLLILLACYSRLSPSGVVGRRMGVLSGQGLALHGLAVTFGSIDWVMSLEPHWFSTIYGVLVMGGQALSAIAFSVVVLAWLVRRAPFNELITANHFHDLGNLMMGFTMLWTYFGFSQYLIIWAANIPEETEWYLHRTGHGWQYIALSIVVFHFAVPFLVLLHRAIKRNAAMVSRVAGLILVMRFVDLYWLSAPAFAHGGEPHVHWLDVVVPVSLAIIWLGYFVYQLRGRALLPLYDPEFREALKHVRIA